MEILEHIYLEKSDKIIYLQKLLTKFITLLKLHKYKVYVSIKYMLYNLLYCIMFNFIYLKALLFFIIFYSLGAIHADAYQAYQTTHNLKAVIEKTCSFNASKIENTKNNKMNVNLSLLTPILPMLVGYCLLNYFVS